MPRPLVLISGTILLAAAAMWVLWPNMPPAARATITLRNKAGEVVPGSEMTGEIIKKDRYVFFKRDNQPETQIYNWDQLGSVVESPASFSGSGRAVEWVEFFSKVGACLAICVFFFGLYQYAHGQKWEREKFLAGIVKDFRGSPKGLAATQMVDSLHVLADGRPVNLYPDRDAGQREKYVSHAMIYQALRTDRDDFNLDELAIRECFDVFFNYLESLDHYISTGLVKKGSVYKYVNYWIELLGKEGRLDILAKTEHVCERPICRSVLLQYAYEYQFYGVQRLLNRYTKRYRLSKWMAGTGLAKRLAEFERVTRLFSTTPLKFLTGLQNWPKTWRSAPAIEHARRG